MLTEIAGWIALLSLPMFLVLDLVHRRYRFDTTRFWRLRATLVTAFIFFFTTGVALGIGTLLEGVSLFDASGLGIWLGAALGVVVYELLHYGYHRLAHAWTPLWRLTHQMHHSAEANDAFGAYFIHPLDAAIFTTLSSVVFFPLLGLAPEAGALGAAFLAFNAVFQHANLRTPRWLGYVIQRPEAHQVHHGRHRNNYADLPVIDMLFGTFENPDRYEGRIGFYKGASSRIGEMLIGRDVSRPPAAEVPPAGVRTAARRVPAKQAVEPNVSAARR